MQNTPVSALTLRVSVFLATIAVIALCGGQLLIASITGTASAVNLIAGVILRKY